MINLSGKDIKVFLNVDQHSDGFNIYLDISTSKYPRKIIVSGQAYDVDKSVKLDMMTASVNIEDQSNRSIPIEVAHTVIALKQSWENKIKEFLYAKS